VGQESQAATTLAEATGGKTLWSKKIGTGGLVNDGEEKGRGLKAEDGNLGS
jgi:hypothetical protein